MSENSNECAIAWVRSGEYAEVTAHSNSRLKGRIEQLAQEHPDDVKIIARNNDGSIFAHIPIRYVKVNPPRRFTEEHLEQARKRMKDRINTYK